MKLTYQITSRDNFINLREVLKTHFNLSDRLLLKLKKANKLLVNSNVSSMHYNIKKGDLIEIYIDFEEDSQNIIPVKMDLDIVYEDDAFIILNKPSKMPVHPSMDHFSDSLSNGVKYYFDSIGLKKKIRPVNRLDKNTSGLVVFAKNEYIQECLVKQMKSNLFYKEYIAVCEGSFKETKGIINAPIARKENSIIERCINENGDKAITEYEVLKYNKEKNYSVVKCVLKTGRTHQIRVHMQYIGHPILGDTLYGNPSTLIDRQALHAYCISFIHPLKNEKITYKASIPEDTLQLSNYL